MDKMGCLFVIILTAIIYGISWALTVGLIKLICVCFGLMYSIKIATGIWIILCILQSWFKSSNKQVN